MDARGFGEERVGADYGPDHGYDDRAAQDSPDHGVGDALFEIGGDERRMHVRAYNHWVSLLKGRPYPAIGDLDPAGIADFGPNSVLIDFTADIEDPAIAFLGRALREECGLDIAVTRIADVPSRSLLSRLTDHYLQIIANRAPIGFEAEFIGIRGHTTLYRGILMPFSSDGGAIDYIYGVINWKEMVAAEVQATLDAELDEAVRAAPTQPRVAPVWADGPSAAEREPAVEAAPAGSLGEQLTVARESAAAVRAADTRSRAALYRALGRAHDFALAADAEPDAYRALLADAFITAQARAPMTPVVKLVFGVDYDKTRLTEFAAVLNHARRHAVGTGALPEFLDGYEGGIKAIVTAERAARKPKAVERPAPPPRATIARVALDTGAATGSVVVLVARVGEDGMLDVFGSVADNAGLSDRAMRALNG